MVGRALYSIFCVLFTACIPIYIWDRRDVRDIDVQNSSTPQQDVLEHVELRLFAKGSILEQATHSLLRYHIYLSPFSYASSQFSRFCRWLVTVSHVASMTFGCVIYMMQYYPSADCNNFKSSSSCESHNIECNWIQSRGLCDQAKANVTIKFTVAGVVVTVVIGSICSMFFKAIIEKVIVHRPRYSLWPDRRMECPCQGDDAVMKSYNVTLEGVEREVEAMFECILHHEVASHGPSARPSEPQSLLRPVPVAAGVWRYDPVDLAATPAMTVMGLDSSGLPRPLSMIEKCFFEKHEQLLYAGVTRARERRVYVHRQVMSLRPCSHAHSCSRHAPKPAALLEATLCLHLVLDLLSPAARSLYTEALLGGSGARSDCVSWSTWISGVGVYISALLAMLAAVFAWAYRLDAADGQRHDQESTWWCVFGLSVVLEATAGAVSVLLVHVVGMFLARPYFKRCVEVLRRRYAEGEEEVEGNSIRSGAVCGSSCSVDDRSLLGHTTTRPCGDPRLVEAETVAPFRGRAVAQHFLSSCRASAMVHLYEGCADPLSHISDKDYLSIRDNVSHAPWSLLHCIENYLYYKYPTYAVDIASCCSACGRDSVPCWVCLVFCAFVMVNSALLRVSGYLLGSFYVISGLAVFFAANSIQCMTDSDERDGATKNWTTTWREHSGPIRSIQSGNSSEETDPSGVTIDCALKCPGTTRKMSEYDELDEESPSGDAYIK